LEVVYGTTKLRKIIEQDVGHSVSFQPLP